MAHRKEIGQLGAGEPLAADRALLIVECSGTVEPDRVRGAGRRRHFIGQCSRVRVRERSPFDLATDNIEKTSVANGAHAPAGWRLILHSESDYATVRRHRDCEA